MNDSKEFQVVESVHSGKLSHVPSQPAVVPSLRCMLSRDQSLRPDTWNLLGTSGNVFDSPLAPIVSSSTPYRGSFTLGNLMLQMVTWCDQARRDLWLEVKNEIETLFQRRDSQGDLPPEILSFQQKETWLINKNFRYRSFILINFPHLQRFYVLEDKIQKPSKCVFQFSFGGNVMIQGSGDGRLGGRFKKIIALNLRLYPIPQFWDAGCEDCVLSEEDPPEFLTSKRQVSLEEQNAQKEDPFLRGRQIAHMICDYFRDTDDHDTVLDYADLFTTHLRNEDVQEFDTRWDDILLSMTKIPPDDVLESLFKLRKRESDQLKTVLELYDREIHQKISKPDYRRLSTMVKRSIDQTLRSRNFDARMRDLKHEQWLRIAEVQENAAVSVESQRAVFERRQRQFLASCDYWRVMTRAKSTPKDLKKSSAPSWVFSPTQRGRRASRNRNLRGRSPSRWCEMLLSMTKIPPNDVLESLYKLRVRETWTLIRRYRCPIIKNSLKGICTGKIPCDTWASSRMSVSYVRIGFVNLARSARWRSAQKG